ncbi:hypothetical protein [Ruthenibacterium lactatiformans]|uniref:Uncharacterized protein n=1 Tax=Ruthenibacterium lactatiformans TaxID=1550024 RepID=A0A6L6LUV4_9FIRM|nr:hypothetical protein [Ruthenibacterium lactatiformans]MTQ81576.1 hypothetical protein [Ruthenibacterium lactatiformans]MTS28535.1 hypothetical protein [Ruthenibacterium lactatiformans]MTS32247.1 hypothetical protein [Ruthenibacterium lactatiformans]MTS38836.1 hypothetical protein [Ruthenibacterium lactatiformans]MTS43047.1 hypothetical protein [Ruthenibacterium lactatiformans]
MLWKIIVIVAAFFLFRRARRRRPALTCLKLWGKTLYRRHKPVEAELLRVEERNGTNLLVCDVPSLQKHALISVDRKRAQQFRRYLASLEAKNGEEARSGIRLEQYKVDGDTFLLTVQNELKQAAYLPSAQREREAQQKCKKAWEAGIVLLAAGAVSGLASASVGAALVAAGGAALALNQPFADVSVWKEQCCLKPRPVDELPTDAENEYPEDYSQWSAAAKYLYAFTAKYNEVADERAAECVETESTPSTEVKETAGAADVEQIVMENILSETAAPYPETQGEKSALPTFSRGFQRTRYAGKDKQTTLPKAE